MERSSFFNAELKGEEYDRVYLAEDYARYFASFIGNGVFPTPSTNLQVVSDGTTMNLTLKQGKAWINGYFYENTEDLSLSVDVADGVLNRIDRVVLRLDFVNREIKSYVKKGEFASSPIAPTLQRDADMYELGIADISINKGVTKLVQADITDLRQNNNYCGLVSGVVQQIDTTNLFTQFQSSFDIWFEHIKGQLSEDAAGNLQNQIDNNDTRIKTWEDFKTNGGNFGGNIGINCGENLLSFSTTRTMNGKQYKSVFGTMGVTGEGIPSTAIRLESDSTPNGVWIGLTEDSFIPSSINGITLGSYSYRFKDIYLDGSNRNATGYTKLPNGIIRQWVEVNVAGNVWSKTQIVFPLQFTTRHFCQGAEITYKNVGDANKTDYVGYISTKLITINANTHYLIVQPLSSNIPNDGYMYRVKCWIEGY